MTTGRTTGRIIGGCFFFLTLLHSSMVQSGTTHCYWIHLNGLDVASTPDFLTGGDYQPLLALEAGQLFSLSPGFAEEISLSRKRRQEIQGHWYYLPRHLVQDDAVTLHFMLIDRDEDTDDDLVLPMRSHTRRLNQTFDELGRSRFSIAEAYIVDGKPRQTNHIQFDFEIERRPGECYTGTAEGNMLDRKYRQDNQRHHLTSRIKHYFERPLLAGWEASLYEEKKTATPEEAFAMANRNLHELVSLGRAVYQLEGSEGFDSLHREFERLYATLRGKTLELSYTETKQGKQETVTRTVPALASDPEWSAIIGQSAADRIPPHWFPQP